MGETCRVGTEPIACGKGGATCTVCDTAGGQSCDPTQGLCVAPACTGCVSGGQCQPGTLQSACGQGGLSCVVCAAHETCQAGRCVSQVACGDCPTGCCKGNQCVQGTEDTACGTSANTCVDCSADGKICDLASRFCIFKQACGSCSSGCCQGNQCVAGDSTEACGTGNDTCVNCKAQGLVCDKATRKCVQGECATCKGCCWEEKCLEGNTNERCGNNGEACFNCTAAGLTCNYNKRQCQPPCTKSDGSPCFQGCCLGKICVQGESPNACGNYGKLCEDCMAAGLTCNTQLRACVNGCPNCLSGCCDGGGVCRAGDLNLECGTQGQRCLNCAALGLICHAARKRCED